MKLTIAVIVVVACVSSLLLAACAGSPTSTPAPTPTTPPPTLAPATARPTATPAPTATSTPKPTPTADTRPIKIGLVDSFTGAAARQCALMRDGAELAIAEINAAGGIKGRKVELAVQDDALDPAKTTSIAKLFLERDKVNIIIGANASSSAIALAKYADANSFPVVGAISASDDLLQYKYYWRILTTNSELAKASLLFAKSLGHIRVGISYMTMAWGTDLKRLIEQYAAECGVTVVGAEGVESGATDALIQAKKLKDANPQAIINPDYASGILAFAQARKSLGWEVPMIDFDTTFTPALQAADPALYEGYYVLAFKDETNPRVKAVYDAYEKKSGKRVEDSNLVAGYDCAKVAMMALTNASNPDDPAAIQKALETSIKDYPQVLGKKNQSSSFTADRHYLLTPNDMVWAIVRSGKIVPLQ